MRILLALSLLAVGCYETPKPNCAFLCGQSSPMGPADQCPEDYACGDDGRCHLVLDNGQLAMCETPLPFDAPRPDAPLDGGIDAPPGTIDASGMIDAATPAPDASPDASVPVTTATGTISVTEISVQGHPELGAGGRVTIEFEGVGAPAPLFDNRVPPGVGCAVWVYDLSSGPVPPTLLDEGTVTISGTTAAIPPCTYYAGIGYLCVAGAGVASGGDAIVDDAGGPNTAGLVDTSPSGYTFSAADVGRYISISGAGANNGEFPIVGVDTGTNTVIYVNPGATTAAFTGGYTVVAGAGPVPTSPPFLADTDSVMVSLASGGEMDIEDFTVTVGAGDAFTLDAASATNITGLDISGTVDETFACDSCGSATISVLSVITTDAPIPPGAPDYYFPDPVDRFAVARCAAFGTSITVPAAALAAIGTADPTRIQTAYFRDNLALESNADMTNQTRIIVGHGIVGFTTIAPPPPPIDAGVPDASPPDAAPPDAFVCSPALAPTDDPGATNQDLVISEINPGDYIELYNNTGAPIALGSSPYWLCSPFVYESLSTLGAGITVPAGGYATVPWPAGFTDVDAGGEVILYDSASFSTSSDIVDFVCWGSNPHGSRAAQAITAGKWSGTVDVMGTPTYTCPPALTGGSIHRLPATDGIDPADYNTTLPSNPMNCTP